MESESTFRAYFYLPATAVAERLWSNESFRDAHAARLRLRNILGRLRGERYADWALAFHEESADRNGARLATKK